MSDLSTIAASARRQSKESTRILDEEGVPVHHAKQEQVLVQEVAVETHVLNGKFIEIVGKQCH
jgi:hypothetical protein